jgi:hypothetical protein
LPDLVRDDAPPETGRPHRIHVYVPAQLQQPGVRLDQDRLEAALVEMARAAVPPIEKRRICHVEVPHEFGQVGPWSLRHEMEVIVHQDIAMQLHLVDPQRAPQPFEKGMPVVVIPEDFPPVIAAAGDVVVRVRVLDP